MRVPMKVDYGVRALVELASHYGEGSMQSAEIASRQCIPQAYLDQLLTTLHKYGFTSSSRGPTGGHVLAKDPMDINLGMVMSTLEGDNKVLDCLIEPNDCVLAHSCAQREVWQSVEDVVQDLLKSITVADLAQRQYSIAEKASNGIR